MAGGGFRSTLPPEVPSVNVRASRLPPGPSLRVLWLADSEREALVETRVEAFAEAADPEQLRIELLGCSRPDGALSSDVGFHPAMRPESLDGRTPRDIAAFMRLVRLLRSGDYDLIHAHLPWACVWGSLAARLTGVPLVASLYGTGGTEGEAAAYAKLERTAVKSLQRWSRRVVALSGAQWDQFVRNHVFPRGLLEVVYPGVDTISLPEPNVRDRLALRRMTGFSADALVAVTIAELEDRRSGVDLLLWAIPEILAAIPDIRFLIVGGGTAKNELIRRVKARGLNRYVHWHDDGPEARRLLTGADFLIHPNSGEPFPFPVVEAMAAGLPVVATRAGGAPELLGPDNAGRLVPSTNPESLAKTVIELAQVPEQLARMGLAGQARVRDKFSSDRWVSQMTRIYRSVVAEAESGVKRPAWPHAGLSVELLGLKKGLAALASARR